MTFYIGLTHNNKMMHKSKHKNGLTKSEMPQKAPRISFIFSSFKLFLKNAWFYSEKKLLLQSLLASPISFFEGL